MDQYKICRSKSPDIPVWFKCHYYENKTIFDCVWCQNKQCPSAFNPIL